MESQTLDSDELIVEAELSNEFPKDDFSLSSVHSHLREIMSEEGYVPINEQKALLSRRTISYILRPRSKEPSTARKLVDKLTTGKSEQERMEITEHLKKTRDDIPFVVKFRFFPLEYENEIDLRTKITVIPAVVRHHQQVRRREDYNSKNAIRSGKQFVRTIAAEFGWPIITEPHTPANSLRSTISDPARDLLSDIKYGGKVVHFCDEADEALKYGLNHSALASYIHAIEWTIIAHVNDEAGLDVIEEEQNGGFHYGLLVDLLREHGRVTQTTVENLEKHRTDRRIMAHHKSGELASSHVHSVKETLEFLIDETVISETPE